MKKIQTYKALSNRIFVFGFLFFDLALIVIIPFIVWVISNSFKVAFGVFVVEIYFAKKHKYRAEGYLKSFLGFLFTPNKFSIKSDSIPSYKEVKCRK